MKVAVYLPPKAENEKCPVFYWLSGEFSRSMVSHMLHKDSGHLLFYPNTNTPDSTNRQDLACILALI